jgi:hypothetical protein
LVRRGGRPICIKSSQRGRESDTTRQVSVQNSAELQDISEQATPERTLAHGLNGAIQKLLCLDWKSGDLTLLGVQKDMLGITTVFEEFFRDGKFMAMPPNVINNLKIRERLLREKTVRRDQKTHLIHPVLNKAIVILDKAVVQPQASIKDQLLVCHKLVVDEAAENAFRR